MMSQKYKDLVEKLNNGRPYLFLGQYFWGQLVTEKIWMATKEQFKVEGEATPDIYLKLEREQNLESVLTWIQNQADHITLPPIGKILADICWNGIFTTAVEDLCERMFRLELRDVQPVYQFDNLPENYKSNKILHISYLFGCLTQTEFGKRPPLSKLEKIRYERNMTRWANQIDSVFLSPFGLLVVDGYNPEMDWLDDRTFYGICSNLKKQQVYLFSADEKLQQNQYIADLIADEIVIPFKESLIDFLILHEEEIVNGGNSRSFSEWDNLITIEKNRVVLPSKLYQKVSREAEILDDYTFVFDGEPDLEKFRDFLYRSSFQPVWYAYQYGMHIPRNYELELLNTVKSDLEKETLSAKPIILHGQTGTGKSVSLASVAYKIKKEGINPILYIDSRSENVDFHILEEFCSWCEEISNIKVVIFWDGSTHGDGIRQYLELAEYLAGKGRKAVIVGTSYHLDSKIQLMYKASYIAAPIMLEDSEQDNFKAIYEKYLGRKLEDSWTDKFDNNFLVHLYRLLPATNSGIRRGVVREVDAETVRFSEIFAEEEAVTPMRQLLEKCGFVVTSKEELTQENIDIVKEIIQSVSVVGQFGLSLPFDIIYRMMGENINYHMGQLLESIDFFVVEQDFDGRLTIFSRNSLEAKIVADSSIASIQRQIELICRIIKNISINELDFLVKLLKAIGPNGQADSQNYGSYFGVLAQAVGALRKEYGIYNERTILQEASFVREYMKRSSEEDFSLDVLVDMQKLLANEIKKLERRRSQGNDIDTQYGLMLCEIASNIGVQLTYYCKIRARTSLILATLEQMEAYLNPALVYAPDPYYPVDIWAWAIKEVLDTGRIENVRESLICKLVSLFEKVELENPDVRDREDFNKRIVDVDIFEQQLNMSDEAFERLLDMNSENGIYIRARKKLRGVNLNSELDADGLKKCKEVINYLENEDYHSIVWSHRKTLYFLFRLEWLVNSGEPVFASEKKVLLFNNEVWQKLYDLLQTISNISGDEVSVQVRFLMGICMFHLHREADGMQMIDSLRDNYHLGGKRIKEYVIASDDHGNARRFRGQLQKLQKPGRAVFYIPELRKSIPYYNREFVSREPKLNEDYEDLKIGFNFMGPRISSIGERYYE